MKKRLNSLLGAVFMTTFLLTGAAWAQEREQADVRIQSITANQTFSLFPILAQYLNCDVIIYSDNDDSAGNVLLNILLPVEVRVISAPTGCAAVPSTSGNYHASVQCHLGTLNVGQSRAVHIVTTLPRLPVVAKTFGAFAWSTTPDPRPGNNFGEVTVTP